MIAARGSRRGASKSYRLPKNHRRADTSKEGHEPWCPAPELQEQVKRENARRNFDGFGTAPLHEAMMAAPAPDVVAELEHEAM